MKKKLFSVNYAITDYSTATGLIIQKAKARESFGVSALAVHGLIESNRNKEFCTHVNKIDLIVPDGQPVRWALNSIHNTKMKDRVCGPDLVMSVYKKANEFNLKLYLYGSTQNVLEKLSTFIETNFPNIQICGIHVDRFREATEKEDEEDVEKINKSGVNLVLVGRGCPRQELWVANHIGKVKAVMMAVGAAFEFHSGTAKRAPVWMQNAGLEWFFRLTQDPKRLWKRYLYTNSLFLFLFLRDFILIKLKIKK